MTPTLYILQAVGFLVQTLPVAVLCFVPFETDCFRLSRKKTLSFVCSGLALLAVIFSILIGALYTSSGQHNKIMGTVANLYMGLCLLSGAVFYFWNVRAKASKKTLVFVLLVHYAAILFTLSSAVVGQINESDKAADHVLIIYGYTNSWINLLLLIITFPVVYSFLKQVVRVSFPVMENRIVRRGCAYLTAALLLYCICVLTLSAGYSFGFYGYPLLLFLLAFVLTDVVIYYMFFAEVKLTAQKRQLEDQLRSFDEQYKQISSSIEESRRARHDLRHHLNMISTLNQSGRRQELTDYLERYNAVYRNLEEQPLCGYPAADSILKYYIECAKEEGITVETDLSTLRDNIGIDAMDLTVLLGNIMENAIEACRELPADALRFIHIQMHKVNISLLVQVENSCKPEPHDQVRFTDGSNFISTKHALLHGQGLKSVRLVAEKYGGSAEFRKVSGVFTTRIVLNLQ